MELNDITYEIEKMGEWVNELNSIISKFNKIIIIGNGGSNSIASHISQDYTKVLDKKAISFSDPSRLTCYINDYGRDNAYVEFLKDFIDKTTLVILISSSGNSMNIVNSAIFCESEDYNYISLSGFKKDNKLNKMEGA